MARCRWSRVSIRRRLATRHWEGVMAENRISFDSLDAPAFWPAREVSWAASMRRGQVPHRSELPGILGGPALSGWSHATSWGDIRGAAGACGPDGAGLPRRVRLAVGGDLFDRGEVRDAATATTTPSPSQPLGSTRPSSSIDADSGAASRTLSSPPWTTCTVQPSATQRSRRQHATS